MIHSELKNEYLEALSYWQLQLQDLHELLLDGKTMSPDKIKGYWVVKLVPKKSMTC